MLPVAFSLSPLENSLSSPPGAFVAPIDEEQATTSTSGGVLSVQINIANSPTTLGAIQTIIVTVLDQGGKPVPEATVHLEVTSPSGYTTVLEESTDASGVHTFVMQIQALQSSVGTFQVKASATKAGYETGQAEATFEVTAEGNPSTTSTQTVTVYATSTTVIPVYLTTLIPTTTTVTQTQVLTTTQKSVITTISTATLTSTAFTNVTNTQTVTTSAAQTTMRTTETATETSTSYTMVLSTTISTAVTTLTSSVQVTQTITILANPVGEVATSFLILTALATLLVPRIRARRLTSKVCPQCGYSNPPYAHSFCIKCGNPLEAPKT
jgi:ribosomal protein L40E